MTAFIVVLLSCLACGIAAQSTLHSASVGARPGVPAATDYRPAVSGPSNGLGGRRPANVPVAFSPNAQPSIVTGPPAGVGGKGRRPSSYRPGFSAPIVGAASEQRPTVVEAPANGPAVSEPAATAPANGPAVSGPAADAPTTQRPTTGAAEKPNGSSQPNSTVRPNNGTNGSGAPY